MLTLLKPASNMPRPMRSCALQLINIIHTLIKSFLGCFFSSLLHAVIADLFEPESNASINVQNEVDLSYVWPRATCTCKDADRILGEFGDQVLMTFSL